MFVFNRNLYRQGLDWGERSETSTRSWTATFLYIYIIKLYIYLFIYIYGVAGILDTRIFREGVATLLQ